MSTTHTTEAAAAHHADNLADWLFSATANLTAQAQAQGLEGDELVAAVRSALLEAVAGR